MLFISIDNSLLYRWTKQLINQYYNSCKIKNGGGGPTHGHFFPLLDLPVILNTGLEMKNSLEGGMQVNFYVYHFKLHCYIQYKEVNKLILRAHSLIDKVFDKVGDKNILHIVLKCILNDKISIFRNFVMAILITDFYHHQYENSYTDTSHGHNYSSYRR